ncbi:MAG TPA: sulfatase [Dysgonomonas sp.]|nr:sulfatase [Dysgonomonas sp.]
MKHVKKLCALALPIALYSCNSKSPDQGNENERPNIIYIMCDDHSYQTISAYGSQLSKLAPTPNIDRLADEGILFQKAFVENSLSTPSRACLMTGLYSHQNGQRQLAEGIDTSKVFFTELLQDAGYQTGVVGKWHMSCEPKGFDFYHILDDQGQYYNPTFKGPDTNGEYIREEGYATSLTTKHALRFLDERNKDKPFCLLIHHKAPHRNWMPEEKYLGLYEDIEFPMPENFWDDYEGKCSASATQKMSIGKDMELVQDLKVEELGAAAATPYDKISYRSLKGELDRMTPEEREAWDKFYKPRNAKFLDAKLEGQELIKWKYQNYIKDYLRCIKSIDDAVGEVLNYLDKNNLKENTIVVYTSDQGFYMGEHGWFDKRFMYEESFRTPLIMRYPKAIKAGTKSEALVQNIDYAPTFLSLAGIEKPEEMSGNSLEAVFDGEKPADWRNSLYYHYYDYPAFHLVRKHDGVRTERYKLIHFYGQGGMKGATTHYQTTPGTREYRVLHMLNDAGYITDAPDINCNELYDLQNDPQEMNNLYGKDGYEDITKELQTLLDNYRKNLNVPQDEY